MTRYEQLRQDLLAERYAKTPTIRRQRADATAAAGDRHRAELAAALRETRQLAVTR